MRSYLPPRENNSSGSSGYSEGGGLYALGLIHANHGAAINDYLLGQLKDAHNEVNNKYDKSLFKIKTLSKYFKF